MVRTLPSHGGNGGSNPLWGTTGFVILPFIPVPRTPREGMKYAEYRQKLDDLDTWHHACLDRLRRDGEDTQEACEGLDREYLLRLRELRQRNL